MMENKHDDLLEFVIPNWALTSLINADDSGLEDEDIKKVDDFVNRISEKYGNALFMLPDEDEMDLGFRWRNDIDGNLGADCSLLYLRPSKHYANGGDTNETIYIYDDKEYTAKELIDLADEMAHYDKMDYNAQDFEIDNLYTAIWYLGEDEVRIKGDVMMDGGYMAKGGYCLNKIQTKRLAELASNYLNSEKVDNEPSVKKGYSWFVYDDDAYLPDNIDELSNMERQKYGEHYTDVDFIEYAKKDWQFNISENLKKFSDGGYMAKGGGVDEFHWKNTKHGTLLYSKNEYQGISITKNSEGGYYVTADEGYRFYNDFEPIEVDTISQAKAYANKEISYKMSDGGYMAKGGVVSKKKMLDYLNMYFDYYDELRTIAVEEDNILTRKMLPNLTDEQIEMAYDDAKYEIKADTQYADGGMMAKGGIIKAVRNRDADYYVNEYGDIDDNGKKKMYAIEIQNESGDVIEYMSADSENYANIIIKKINKEQSYADGGETYAKGGNIPSIEKRVVEVNKLIQEGNEKGVEVIDKTTTWEAPMKYKPLKYSNGVLYIEYEEFDLYSYAKGKVPLWKTKKERIGKSGMGLDDQRETLTHIARMYRSAINHFNTYGYADGGMPTFQDKVDSISASLLKRKKVSPSVQKDYGKTYSKSEAIESAKRIAGAMRKKEKARKK